MDHDRRFELRKRNSDTNGGAGADASSEELVGFGAWRAADGAVLSCRLTHPALRLARSIDTFLAELAEDERLVWVDPEPVPEPADGTAPGYAHEPAQGTDNSLPDRESHPPAIRVTPRGLPGSTPPPHR